MLTARPPASPLQAAALRPHLPRPACPSALAFPCVAPSHTHAAATGDKPTNSAIPDELVKQSRRRPFQGKFIANLDISFELKINQAYRFLFSYNTNLQIVVSFQP